MGIAGLLVLFVPAAAFWLWQAAHLLPVSFQDLLQLCAESARDDISGGPAWVKNPRARRSAAAGADIPPQAGHRDHVLTRRPDRDKDDQGDHEC
jgi:hypothetical protein